LNRLTHNNGQKGYVAADDLAQITFMRAYEKQHHIKDDAAMRSWLFKIAYRCFLDEYRKQKRREDLSVLSPDDDMVDIRYQDKPRNRATGVSVDIERAMQSLAPECRAVVMLCLAYGFSHREAAHITHLPLGTIKSHCRRGKAELRQFLSAYETDNYA